MLRAFVFVMKSSLHQKFIKRFMGNVYQMRTFIKMIFGQLLFQKFKLFVQTCQVLVNNRRIGWLFHSFFLIFKIPCLLWTMFLWTCWAYPIKTKNGIAHFIYMITYRGMSLSFFIFLYYQYVLPYEWKL